MVSIFDYQDRVNSEKEIRAYYLKYFGELNLGFLEGNADLFTRLDWNYISYFSVLTPDFIECFNSEINMSLILSRDYTKDNVKEIYRDDYEVLSVRRGFQIEPLFNEKFATLSKEEFSKHVNIRADKRPFFTLADEFVKKQDSHLETF